MHGAWRKWSSYYCSARIRYDLISSRKISQSSSSVSAYAFAIVVVAGFAIMLILYSWRLHQHRWRWWSHCAHCRKRWCSHYRENERRQKQERAAYAETESRGPSDSANRLRRRSRQRRSAITMMEFESGHRKFWLKMKQNVSLNII